MKKASEHSKRVEENLKEDKKLLNSIIEETTDTIFVKDLSGRYVMMNAAGANIIGKSIEEIIGKDDTQLFPHDIACKLMEEDQRIIASGKNIVFDEELPKDGNIHIYHTLKVPYRSHTGNIIGVIGIARDITERKRAEEELKMLKESLEQRVSERTAELVRANEQLQKEATERKQAEEKLRESEEQFRSLFEQAAVGIVHVASNGQFLRVNKRFCEITGYTEQEILERAYQDITYPDDLYAQNEARKKVLDGETSSYRIEKRYIRKDGTIIWGNLTAAVLIRKPGGEPSYFVSVLEDITERKKMKDTLLQSEKLRAMGVLTSGIAHDFNNILAIISGNVQLLQGTYRDHKEMADALRTIRRATNDGSEIVQRMRKFTKTDRDTSKFVLVYIKEILEQAIDFLRPRWMNIAQAMGVKYHIDKGGIKELPAIQGNPSELREVFINIINNALDSMHDGGRISFRTWTDNNTVFASISDTGVGMTEDVRKRLFDPFFTTRRAEGSGLGMSLVYGIVTEHGGKIDVKSEEGKGTTLILSIPIMRGTTQQAVSPKLSQEIKVKKLRILVVDDEQDICMILDKFFSEDGHIVKTVNRGAEAIKLLKTEVFDLILSDLIMPEVSGYDVTKAVKALEKKPKVGLITGWGDTIKAKDKESLKVDFIVKKPFDFSELSRSINNALST